MTDRVQALRAQFLSELPERLSTIKALWAGLNQAGKSTGPDCEELMNRCHALHGTAATFEFEDLSDASGDVEMLLATLVDSLGPLSPQQLEKVGQHMSALFAAAEPLVKDSPASAVSTSSAQAPATPSDSTPAAASDDVAPAPQRQIPSGRSLIIVDDEAEAGAYLAELLKEKGWKAHAISKLDELAAKITEVEPVAVLMDIVFPEGDMAGVDAVSQMARDGSMPAVIFVSVRSDMTARLEAMRAGAAGYFTKPVDIERLSGKLEELAEDDPTPYRVMVVDDEPIQATFNTTILEKAGMVVQAVTRPGKVLDAMEAFEPDLMLLDMHMPEINGLELAQVIRQREDGDDIPIVFLTADTDDSIRSEAMSLGVEDYLTKPVKPKALVLAVRSRIERHRALHAKLKPVERPVESRVVDRDDFEQTLDELIEMAGVDGGRASLLHIEVDDKEPHDDDECAETIGETLRGDQKVLSLGAGAFLVLLPDANVDVARRVAADIASEGRDQFPDLSCSVGICDLRDADEASEVLSGAKTACQQARKRGAGRVAVFEAAKDAKERKEQDKELLSLVQTTLKNRSFRLVYQPVVSLHGGEESYYEALLRIFDPKGQEIPLARIISAAEAANLMHVFDRAVIHTMIRTAVEQFGANRAPRFFLNLSGTSTRDPSLVPWVKKQMDAVKLPADRLIFQIGTPDYQTAPKQVREMIVAFAAIGIDCGLSRFPCTDEALHLIEGLKTRFVKFDKATVDRLLKEKPVSDELKDVLKALRIDKRATVVPFVDDAAAMATLWDLRADFVQGYFIGAPEAQFVTPE